MSSLSEAASPHLEKCSMGQGKLHVVARSPNVRPKNLHCGRLRIV